MTPSMRGAQTHPPWPPEWGWLIALDSSTEKPSVQLSLSALKPLELQTLPGEQVDAASASALCAAVIQGQPVACLRDLEVFSLSLLMSHGLEGFQILSLNRRPELIVCLIYCPGLWSLLCLATLRSCPGHPCVMSVTLGMGLLLNLACHLRDQFPKKISSFVPQILLGYLNAVILPILGNFDLHIK